LRWAKIEGVVSNLRASADGRVIYTTPPRKPIESAFAMQTFTADSGEPQIIMGGNFGVMGMYNADTGAIIRALRYTAKREGNPAEGIMTYRDEVRDCKPTRSSQ
jgi:hypothetical protein